MIPEVDLKKQYVGFCLDCETCSSSIKDASVKADYIRVRTNRFIQDLISLIHGNFQELAELHGLHTSEMGYLGKLRWDAVLTEQGYREPFVMTAQRLLYKLMCVHMMWRFYAEYKVPLFYGCVTDARGRVVPNQIPFIEAMSVFSLACCNYSAASVFPKDRSVREESPEKALWKPLRFKDEDGVFNTHRCECFDFISPKQEYHMSIDVLNILSHGRMSAQIQKISHIDHRSLVNIRALDSFTTALDVVIANERNIGDNIHNRISIPVEYLQNALYWSQNVKDFYDKHENANTPQKRGKLDKIINRLHDIIDVGDEG